MKKFVSNFGVDFVTLSSMTSGPRHRTLFSSSWRRCCIVVCCFFLLLILLYWSTTTHIVAQWETDTFSYGFLVIPTCAVLVWLARDRVATLNPYPSFWAIPALAACSFGWLLGSLTATDAVQEFCLVAMFVVFLWGVLGTPVSRKLIMPLTFLFFAVPLGEALIPRLQDFSAWFAVKLLEFCNVPVLREGRLISVPTGTWEVAEACSGIRYLASSMVVGFLFAGLVYRSWPRRITFFVASAIVPIFANGLRVFAIIILAYFSGNRIAAGVDHLIYGWVFFTLVTFLLVSLGLAWREKNKADLNGSSKRNAKELKVNLSSPIAPKIGANRINSFGAIGLAIVALAPLGIKFERSPDPSSVHLVLPTVFVPWHTSTNKPSDEWKPSFLAPDAELFQSYASPSHKVKLYVAGYGPARLDAKLISSGNILFDSKLWQFTGDAQDTVTLGGQSFRVHIRLIRSELQTLTLWSWYFVDGHYTDNDIFAKLLLARSRLLRKSNLAAAIVVALENEPDRQRQTQILQDFLSHISLDDILRSAEHQIVSADTPTILPIN